MRRRAIYIFRAVKDKNPKFNLKHSLLVQSPYLYQQLHCRLSQDKSMERHVKFCSAQIHFQNSIFCEFKFDAGTDVSLSQTS